MYQLIVETHEVPNQEEHEDEEPKVLFDQRVAGKAREPSLLRGTRGMENE